MEVIKMGDQEEDVLDVGLLAQYLPNFPLFPPPSNNNPDMLRFWDARTLTRDVDKFFQR